VRELMQTQKVLGEQTLGPVGLRSGVERFTTPVKHAPSQAGGNRRALVPAVTQPRQLRRLRCSIQHTRFTGAVRRAALFCQVLWFL